MQLAIDLRNLDHGHHHLAVTPSAENLEIDADQFKDISVDLDLHRTERRLVVSFRVRAVATLECDRTLEPFDQTVEGAHAVFFTADPGEDTEADEDAFEMDADADSVDIAQPVRDTLLLALPTRRIAPGAEDVELQTEYGVSDDEEDAIDPRWSALKALKFDDEG